MSGEKRRERDREIKRGERGLFGGDEASGSSWGDAACGRGCPGFRVRADPPIGHQDRPRLPWQPQGLAGGDYETGVTRLSVATPLLEATSGDAAGWLSGGGKEKEEAQKYGLSERGYSLSLFALLITR